jgi:PAS domain S-box-containing protein
VGYIGIRNVKYRVQSTNKEKLIRDDDFIVSKTDLKGRITYGNKIFLEFSGYSEKEIIGAPHNIVRHPDMPRGVFKFVWDELLNQRGVMAYVKNLAADGSFYWVLANMTPSYDDAGNVIGYYSVRRAPSRQAIRGIEEVYQRMLVEESKTPIAKQTEASMKLLVEILREKGMSYADFVHSL